MTSSIFNSVVGRAGYLAAAIAVLIVAISAVQNGLMAAFMSEEYGAEIGSLVLWAFAIPLVLLTRVPTPKRSIWLAGLFALFFLRELDFHNWWFEPGLLHVQIFSSPVPLWQKAVSFVTMVVILALVGVLLVTGAKPFLRGLLRLEPPVLWAALGLACAAISTQLDGIGRRLAPFGIEMTGTLQSAAVVAEEALELAFPIFIITAISSAWSHQEGRISAQAR